MIPERIVNFVNRVADEIEERFKSLRPSAENVTWYLIDARLLPSQPDPDPKTLSLAEEYVAAEVPVKEMVKSAEIAAEAILNHKLECLGDKSYKDLISFTGADQEIVDEIAGELSSGYPTFGQVRNATPRHALAATIFAFEQDRSNAGLINRTFKHFV